MRPSWAPCTALFGQHSRIHSAGLRAGLGGRHSLGSSEHKGPWEAGRTSKSGEVMSPFGQAFHGRILRTLTTFTHHDQERKGKTRCKYDPSHRGPGPKLTVSGGPRGSAAQDSSANLEGAARTWGTDRTPLAGAGHQGAPGRCITVWPCQRKAKSKTLFEMAFSIYCFQSLKATHTISHLQPPSYLCGCHFS